MLCFFGFLAFFSLLAEFLFLSLCYAKIKYLFRLHKGEKAFISLIIKHKDKENNLFCKIFMAFFCKKIEKKMRQSRKKGGGILRLRRKKKIN